VFRGHEFDPEQLYYFGMTQASEKGDVQLAVAVPQPKGHNSNDREPSVVRCRHGTQIRQDPTIPDEGGFAHSLSNEDAQVPGAPADGDFNDS
jgi:hypothetical protein